MKQKERQNILTKNLEVIYDEYSIIFPKLFLKSSTKEIGISLLQYLRI